MALVVGKQSTLNDLGDLKADLETKIAAAAAIKVGEVSQIEGGFITGSVYTGRPTGVYRVMWGADVSAYGVGVYQTGMLLQMSNPDDQNNYIQMYAQWFGGLSFLARSAEGTDTIFNVLTDRNTITDVNGFIKAA